MGKYIIYCDESIQKGDYFSNFYGGVILKESNYDYVTNELNKLKLQIELKGELKWSNVSEQTLEKYKKFIDKYFELISKDYFRVRIMFTQEYVAPRSLTDEQKANGYFLLYYQFIKHAFGILYSNIETQNLDLKIFLDKLPKKKKDIEEFKEYVYGIQFENKFKPLNLTIHRDNITDVDSKSHIILQGMDIILGSMAFVLNDKHKVKKEGSRFRGKKTIAKHKLYKHINKKIQDLHQSRLFNIGISTGYNNDINNRWLYKYSHWRFTSRDFVINENKGKRK